MYGRPKWLDHKPGAHVGRAWEAQRHNDEAARAILDRVKAGDTAALTEDPGYLCADHGCLRGDHHPAH